MSTIFQYFFVIFNIFTIHFVFCAICTLFFMKSTLIFFFLAFHCSTCSAVPCIFLFHMFHFSVFHYFFDNCNYFCNVFTPFCAVYQKELTLLLIQASPNHCLLLHAIEAGDLLDSVKKAHKKRHPFFSDRVSLISVLLLFYCIPGK